jgi:hypothetical protein
LFIIILVFSFRKKSDEKCGSHHLCYFFVAKNTTTTTSMPLSSFLFDVKKIMMAPCVIILVFWCHLAGSWEEKQWATRTTHHFFFHIAK